MEVWTKILTISPSTKHLYKGEIGMTTFNWWTVVGPMMWLAATAMGYFSVKRDRCAVYVRDISAVSLIAAVASSAVFTVMVMLESYIGIVDFALRHFVAPGESEALADVVAIAILVGVFIVYAVIFEVLCILSADLHDAYLRKQAKKVRHDHYNARTDHAKLVELRKECHRAECGYCPVELHKVQPTTVVDADTHRATLVSAEPVCTGTVAEPLDLVETATQDVPRLAATGADTKEQLAQIFAKQKENGQLQICILELSCRTNVECEIIDQSPKAEKIG